MPVIERVELAAWLEFERPSCFGIWCSWIVLCRRFQQLVERQLDITELSPACDIKREYLRWGQYQGYEQCKSGPGLVNAEPIQRSGPGIIIPFENTVPICRLEIRLHEGFHLQVSLHNEYSVEKAYRTTPHVEGWVSLPSSKTRARIDVGLTIQKRQSVTPTGDRTRRFCKPTRF